MDLFSVSGDEWLLVLEDDAILLEEIFNFITDVEKILITQPAVFLLGHSKTKQENLHFQRLKQPLFDIKHLAKRKFGRNSKY